MKRYQRRRSARVAIARLVLYLLPGLMAAAGAAAAFVTASKVTGALVAVTGVLVVLGLGAPPLVDWLRDRYVQQADLAARERRGLADKLAAELRDHFGPRGRGILPSQVRGGSYFSGRAEVLRQLAAWLADQGDFRSRVVTGEPGSGKSAVLGRLVLLTDRRQRHPDRVRAAASPETMPPAGVISVAVHARGRTVDEIAAQIALGLGLDSTGAGGLLAMLREGWRPRAEVVLVDAVDEAADPLRLIADLLVPLASAAARTRIRLIAATRPGGGGGLLRLFGSSAVILDLDTPAYLEPGDVEEYVRRTLLADDDVLVSTPYRDRPEAAAQVARAVAARAGPCFLVAQLSALSLMASSTPPVVTAGWADEFPATVGAAMEQYLRQVQPGGRSARDLLTALAWAEGDGLDDLRTWAAVATAIGAGEYSEHDVVRLLTDSAVEDLLHRTSHGERTAFRLFHEALGEHLRQQSSKYQAPVETQRRIAEVLIAHVPKAHEGGPDWTRADQYARTYLPVHAAHGQVLDSLLDQAGFLATAEPARLLAALPAARTERGRRVARIVERVGQQILQAPPEERSCYLEMAAKMAADDQLARDIAGFAPQRPWSVLWAHWQQLADSQLLGHHDDWVLAVSTVETPRGTVVVSASAWAIRAWYLTDGSPAPGIREPASPIREMAAFGDGGDVVVLTLHSDGELQRAVLGGLAPPQTIASNRSHGLWLVRYNGELAVVTVTRDELAEVLSVADGQPIGPAPVNVASRRVWTAGNAGQRCLLVTGTYDEEHLTTPEVVILDLADGCTIGSPLRPAEHFPLREPVAMWSAALTEQDDNPMLLFCPDFRAPVVLWDPVGARMVSEPHYDQAGVTAACILRSSERELFCWGDVDGDLYIQPGREQVISRLAAHDAGIETLAAYDSPAGTVVVTGGRDGAVRAWYLRKQRFTPSAPRAAIDELAVLPAVGDQPPMIAALRRRSSVVVLGAVDGRILAELEPAAGAHYRHIAVRTGLETALITVDSQNQVAMWRPSATEPLLSWRLPADVEVYDVAVTSGSEPFLLLVTMPDRRLAFFDLASGVEARAPLTCHAQPFRVISDPDQPPGVTRFLTATGRELCEVRLWSVTATQATCRDLAVDSDRGMTAPSAFVISSGLLPRPVAVGVGAGSSLFVWDMESGEPLVHTGLKRGHHMQLRAVDIAEIAGRDLILSCGYSCSLALLPLHAQDEHHIRVGSPLFSVKSVARDQVAVAGSRGVMLIHLSAHLPSL